MRAILSTLLPQMTVSVAPRLVTESRDQHYTPAPTSAPARAENQALAGISLPQSHVQDPLKLYIQLFHPVLNQTQELDPVGVHYDPCTL